jgi:hypothetical protein
VRRDPDRLKAEAVYSWQAAAGLKQYAPEGHPMALRALTNSPRRALVVSGFRDAAKRRHTKGVNWRAATRLTICFGQLTMTHEWRNKGLVESGFCSVEWHPLGEFRSDFVHPFPAS